MEAKDQKAPPTAPAEKAPSPVKLNHAKTAEGYECTRTENHRVYVPGVYSGLLSDVTPEAAEAMISQGHTALVKKTK
jgi:hypothetical protein